MRGVSMRTERFVPGLAAARLLRLLLALVPLLLTACAGPGALPGGIETDSAPRVVPDGLENLPDPVPRWEPARSAGNRSPYMVFGRTYHVMPSADGYAEEGLASWYGRKFHGRNTSNGERYDMFALTAAHKSLPLPSWLKVTNVANGRSTIVRVNDRGPFHDERVIDLSYAAAVKLGFADRGVARVRLEVIQPPRPLPGGAARETASRADREALPMDDGTMELEKAAGRIWLQAGAFGDPASAAALRIALLDVLGAGPGGVDVRLEKGVDMLTRVRIGPITDLAEAGRLQALITVADVAGVPLIIRE